MTALTDPRTLPNGLVVPNPLALGYTPVAPSAVAMRMVGATTPRELTATSSASSCHGCRTDAGCCRLESRPVEGPDRATSESTSTDDLLLSNFTRRQDQQRLSMQRVDTVVHTVLGHH